MKHYFNWLAGAGPTLELEPGIVEGGQSAAAERKREGGRKYHRGSAKEKGSVNFSEPYAKPDDKRALAVVAKAVGMTRPTLEKATYVVEGGGPGDGPGAADGKDKDRGRDHAE